MPRRASVPSDLGLNTDPVGQLSDQPWMPMPSARVIAPEGGDAEGLLRGLAQINSGVSSLMQKRATERRQREERESVAQGRRAGFDPKFQAAIDAGEVTPSDSSAFELGRSEAAAEADGNVLNQKLADVLRPEMTDAEYESAFQSTYESVANSRDASDSIYHAQLGQTASRIREGQHVWLAGQRRSAAENDAILQLRRVAAQRTREWVEAGSGNIESLKAELSAVDHHAAGTGLSSAQRSTLLADTLADMIDVTGNPAIADAADMEVFGGGRLDDLVGSKVAARRAALERTQRADARSARVEQRAQLTEARSQLDSDLADFALSNPNAPLPDELVQRARGMGESDKLLAYSKMREKARTLNEAAPDVKAGWLVEASNGTRDEGKIIEGYALGYYGATERNAQLTRAKSFKDNGALSKRPEVGHGIQRIRSLFADERKSDDPLSKIRLLEPAAAKLETTTQELEEQAIVEYENRMAGFLSANAEASPNEIAREATAAVNEVYQVGQLRRNAEKTRLTLAPPTAATEGPTASKNPQRDMIAVQALASHGPIGMLTYRNLAAVPTPPPPALIMNAVTLWRTQKQPHPGLVAGYRAYQELHGPIPYATYLAAARVISLNVGGAATTSSPTQ